MAGAGDRKHIAAITYCGNDCFFRTGQFSSQCGTNTPAQVSGMGCTNILFPATIEVRDMPELWFQTLIASYQIHSKCMTALRKDGDSTQPLKRINL